MKFINNSSFTQPFEVLGECDYDGSGQDLTDGCDDGGTCAQDYLVTVESHQGYGYTYDGQREIGTASGRGDAPGDGSADGSGDASIASDPENFDFDDPSS